MAEDEATATPEQIAEYESQLAGIVDLLRESPGDESLLALKRDLEELLELSRASATPQDTANLPAAVVGDTASQAAASRDDLPLPPPPPPPGLVPGQAEFAVGMPAPPPSVPEPTTGGEAPAASAAVSKKEKPHKAKKSKKKQTVRDFVLPDHLVPRDEDTDAERNKKRRAAKALKSKWRAQKKEIESSNRQKSWQSFRKKSSSSSSGSIFATREGVNDRVGVVSKKQLTEFGARKRHK